MNKLCEECLEHIALDDYDCFSCKVQYNERLLHLAGLAMQGYLAQHGITANLRAVARDAFTQAEIMMEEYERRKR